MRDLGVTRAVSQQVPEAAVPVLVVVTFFGSPTFYLVASPIFSYLGYRRSLFDRGRALRFLAIAALVLGGTTLLKNGLALPRPPASLHLVAENGFGFPSGHASVTTGVLFALALLVERGDRTRWILATGAGAVLIGATRILLGVHYLVDVLAGFTVGLAFVGVGLSLTRHTVPGTFLLAAVVGISGIALAV